MSKLKSVGGVLFLGLVTVLAIGFIIYGVLLILIGAREGSWGPAAAGAITLFIAGTSLWGVWSDEVGRSKRVPDTQLSQQRKNKPTRPIPEYKPRPPVYSNIPSGLLEEFRLIATEASDGSLLVRGNSADYENPVTVGLEPKERPRIVIRVNDRSNSYEYELDRVSTLVEERGGRRFFIATLPRRTVELELVGD